MIDNIHQDHKNMMQLLQVLRSKVVMLKADKEIDYLLIKSIISYLKNYSNTYHHPMEDLIYSYYLQYQVVENKVANRLNSEHKHLKEITCELDEMLSMILLDAIVSKDDFIEKLDCFVVKQEQHLLYEEREVLPAIKSSLSADDWLGLEQQWRHLKYVDPLFGNKISEEFKALAEHINREE